MQNPFSPKAGNNSAVDALIGNAYEVVKYVAYYVKEIQYVALNMVDVHRVAQGMYEHVFLTAPIVALDSTVTITLPEDLTTAMILNCSVTVLTADDEIYGVSPDNFSWVISGGAVVVTIPVGAPASFAGATARCLINWQSPVVVG